MNRVAQMTMTPRPSTTKNELRRTGFPCQAAPPEEPLRLTPIPDERLLTSRQVAAILGVSVETLKKWRQRHKSPSFFRFPNGAVRYSPRTVMKFLKDCTFQPEPTSTRAPAGPAKAFALGQKTGKCAVGKPLTLTRSHSRPSPVVRADDRASPCPLGDQNYEQASRSS